MKLINRDSTEEDIDYYWRDSMQYRMEEFWEVVRLVTIVKGFYYEHLLWEGEDGTSYKEHEDLYNFCLNNKRPFGNKYTTQSIIFNLGWDSQRVMCYAKEPKWVSDIADNLYKKVLLELQKEK